MRELNIRQKKLAKDLLENKGKEPLGKMMVKAGYKKGYARNPQLLKRTLTWKELMDKYLPDDLLAEKHKALLNKEEVVVIGKKGERETVLTGVLDANAVGKGLDMAYKLKNKYPKGQDDEKIITIHVKND